MFYFQQNVIRIDFKNFDNYDVSLSGQRSQTLASLFTDCMHLNNSGCVFYISKLLKTSCPKSHQQPIEFKSYPHDVSLCVIALIKLYLDKTAARF